MKLLSYHFSNCTHELCGLIHTLNWHKTRGEFSKAITAIGELDPSCLRTEILRCIQSVAVMKQAIRAAAHNDFDNDSLSVLHGK